MKSSAQVVVIGGGVVGAAVLYHLTKAGWTDVVLLERKQLTAGSTWHAAGGMHTLNGDPNVATPAAVHRQPVPRDRGRVRPELQHPPARRADAGRHARAARLAAHGPGPRAATSGMHMEIISVGRGQAAQPAAGGAVLRRRAVRPGRGHVDPYGVTHAYAICARNRGAEVYTAHVGHRRSRQRADGTWDVITDTGETIHAEHVVNAGGLWAREVGRMVGLELPVLAMEHTT